MMVPVALAGMATKRGAVKLVGRFGYPTPCRRGSGIDAHCEAMTTQGVSDLRKAHHIELSKRFRDSWRLQNRFKTYACTDLAVRDSGSMAAVAT